MSSFGRCSPLGGGRRDWFREIVSVETARELADLKKSHEARRLRARDAVELLRGSFRLRTNCNRVDHAAEDACAHERREASKAGEL